MKRMVMENKCVFWKLQDTYLYVAFCYGRKQTGYLCWVMLACGMLTTVVNYRSFDGIPV